MLFKELQLSEATLQGVLDAGYTSPTPIQAQAIPALLAGQDICATAQTGTGKTASFLLPTLDILGKGRAKARMPRALILEPTRELAQQVADDFALYGKHHKLTHALLIGGEGFGDQEKALMKGADILIATPGRLLDFFQKGKILLNDVKVFVIDEADRMLDMGFIPDIEKLAKVLPMRRQTALLSATMPAPIRKLASQFMRDPVEIAVSAPATTASTITQYKVTVGRQEIKRQALRHILKKENVEQAIIFCNRKRDVDELYRSMDRHGFSAGALHGDIVQSIRNKTLDGFKNGHIQFLIASDVAARGIDIDHLPYVFNFDVPTTPDDYVHRIGRTGRAGRQGTAFTFMTPREKKAMAAVVEITKKELDDYDMSDFEGAQTSDPKKAPQERKSRTPRKASEKNSASPKPENKAERKDAPRPEKKPRNSGRTEPEIIGFGDETPAFFG